MESDRLECLGFLQQNSNRKTHQHDVAMSNQSTTTRLLQLMSTLQEKTKMARGGPDAGSCQLSGLTW